MKRLASPVIWRGILAIGVGIIAVAWPAITIWAFVILFAAYAFLAAGMETARATCLRPSVRLPGTSPWRCPMLPPQWSPSPGQESPRSRSPSRCGVAFIIDFFEMYLAFGSGRTAGQRALLG